MLKFREKMFTPVPNNILVCYNKYQLVYSRWEQELGRDIRCMQGLCKDLLDSEMELRGTLLIFDDFMTDIVSDPFYTTLYTAGRHRGLDGIITIWHQIFPQGRSQRTISLNQNAYILMHSPRIRSQVPYLGSQLGIRALLSDAYRQASLTPYGYLVIDYTNKSDVHADQYSIRTNVFPDESGPTYCFL